MITINHIDFGYRRGTDAVSDASGIVPPGIHLLLGENGAGKTTLLKLIAGLLKPRKGDCCIDGAITAERKPSVMQRLFFLPDELDIPASTIIELAKNHASFYPNFNAEVLAENLADFGLSGHEELAKVSLGMRRKLLAAYSLALGVDVLLLDEPANGLDIDSKKALRRMMARCVTAEQTVIVSTHNISDLRELYDGLLLMHRSSLELCMTTEDIATRISCVRLTNAHPDALFSEHAAGQVHSLIPNVSGDISDVDFALLYSAIMSNQADKILKILQ